MFFTQKTTFISDVLKGSSVIITNSWSQIVSIHQSQTAGLGVTVYGTNQENTFRIQF